MTDNTDWDDELKDLVDGLMNDAAEVPGDLVDSLDSLDSLDSPADLGGPTGPTGPTPPADKDMAELLAERTADLQRLQAEYINYKRRVERDRDLARQRGIEAVLVDLLPVLDGIAAARAHGELTEGESMLANEVAKVATKYGLTAYGAPGDPFDPHIHEALMHIDQPGYPVTSVAQVFQPGYSIRQRVIRPARVGVAEADESAANVPAPNPPSTPAPCCAEQPTTDNCSDKPANGDCCQDADTGA